MSRWVCERCKEDILNPIEHEFCRYRRTSETYRASIASLREKPVKKRDFSKLAKEAPYRESPTIIKPKPYTAYEQKEITHPFAPVTERPKNMTDGAMKHAGLKGSGVTRLPTIYKSFDRIRQIKFL